MSIWLMNADGWQAVSCLWNRVDHGGDWSLLDSTEVDPLVSFALAGVQGAALYQGLLEGHNLAEVDNPNSGMATLGTMAASETLLGRGAAWGVYYALGATDSLPTGLLPEEYRGMLAEAEEATLELAPLVGAYPNPAKDRLMITYPAAQTAGKLEVLDAVGRTVLSQRLVSAASFIELDVRGWKDGLYLARVLNEGRVVGETKCTIVR